MTYLPIAAAMNPFLVIGLIVLAFVVLMGLLGLKTVQQANVMLIERFGRYHRTLQPGINIIWPLIDKSRGIDWREIIETAPIPAVDGPAVSRTRRRGFSGGSRHLGARIAHRMFRGSWGARREARPGAP